MQGPPGPEGTKGESGEQGEVVNTQTKLVEF